jgi:hypothetical protein
MGYRKVLATVLVVLLGLLVSASGAALVAFAGVSFRSGSWLKPGDAATIVFAFTLYLGFLPAILYGAPAFYVLHRHNRATWPWSVVLGLLPGLLLRLISSDPGAIFWAVACGVVVALFTRSLLGQGHDPAARTVAP